MKTAFLLSLLLLAAAPFARGGGPEVSIPWARAWPVVTPDTAADFGWRLRKPDKETVPADFSAMLTSPSGVEEHVARVVTLASGETQTVPFPLTGKEKGVWKLIYNAPTGKTLPPAKVVQFAYMDPAGPDDARPDFFSGIVSHTGRLENGPRAAQLDAAAFAGGKTLRDSVEWNPLQPAPGQWNWRAMDDLVAHALQLAPGLVENKSAQALPYVVFKTLPR